MTATVYTEALHPMAFVVSEEEGYRSRDAMTVAQSQTIVAGQVMGKTAVVAGATSSSAADASNTGNGTLTLDGTAPVAAGAQDGVYRVVCDLAGASAEFTVSDPKGIEIGRVANGGTFNNQIKFAMAAGGTNFAAGDAFSVTIGLRYDGDMQYAVWNPTGTDGTQRVAGIAGYAVTTGSGVTANITGIVRAAEVRAADLTWPSGATTAQKNEGTDQLKALGIIPR